MHWALARSHIGRPCEAQPSSPPDFSEIAKAAHLVATSTKRARDMNDNHHEKQDDIDRK